MKSYSAYLFDADGTLFDTTEMIYQCFLFTCAKYGNPNVTREQVFANIGIPLKPQLEHFLGPLSSSLEVDVIKTHMDYQLSIYKDFLRLFPGTAETLKRLKSMNKRLAVVTSRKMYTLQLYLEHTHIAVYFDVLVTPESTQNHKPHPEPALQAVKMLHCPVKESLFIGDAVFDMECGSCAGMDTAFVIWSKNTLSSLTQKPTYCLQTMSELTTFP